MSPRGAALALWLLGAALAAPLTAAAAPKFPALSGRVVDEAEILSPATEAELSAKSEGLEQQTGRQLVVVTLPSLQGYEIEDYGYQLGRAWGIGSAERDDGVLFLVAPNDRQVRIEVGYGLEPVLTDALSNVILQTRVLPKFRDGQVEAGVVDGTSALVEQLSLPEGEAKARVVKAAEQPKSSNAGSGFGGFIVLLILFLIFSGIGRRGRRGGLASALPWIILGALSDRDRGGGWGGGGGGGWGGGGGGFGGGGGGFGGGGSSGRW